MTDEPKTLIVTGASRGIGACVAARASESGYRVVGLSQSGTSASGLPCELRACDVSDISSVRAALSDLKRLPNLYGLVNAAGIASMNLHLTTPFETMQRVVGVNLLGTMYCSALVGKCLARARRGRIINFSTIAVALGLKGESSYCASKGGVEAFSRSFAREMAEFNVTVNAIAPGPMDTDLLRGVPDNQIETIVRRQVVPRMSTLDDVWDIVQFLLSDRAAMVSGQTIHPGGV
jgi:3-oxoacyl-[acyl-carrier protein] reductase